MQLSIIIVNYNVKHFLEQCLYSLVGAIKGLEAEVIVVDNNSGDGSIAYLMPIFEWVHFICNKHNPGFGKANNQGVALAKGKYVLFLNPDTLVADDCLHKCLAFMEANSRAGALGINMVDGSGNFLPESKRGFPSPLTSFFKLTGIAALFPKSAFFSRYHLGHLSNTQNHQVDVLAGAFMLLRKTVLDSVGTFDEAFFMYGEDVDLSYRVQKAGWENYYFADSVIIHFKGESTKKNSLNYVHMFYHAMSLFVRKHYKGGSARFFILFIQLAIWVRAGITAVVRFFIWAGLPIFDIIICIFSLMSVGKFWSVFIKPSQQPQPLILWVFLPVFSLSFILISSISGLYDKLYSRKRSLIAMISALVINLAIYSLLSEQYRFSRGIILLGGFSTIFGILLFRKMLLINEKIITGEENKEQRQTLIAGSVDSYENVVQLLKKADKNVRILGRISKSNAGVNSVGSIESLHFILTEMPAREIIFCIDNEFTLIQAIACMKNKYNNRVRYKFYYTGSQSIVGSDSKETSGDTISLSEEFFITEAKSRRLKRVVEIFACISLFIALPVHLIFVKNKYGLIRNIYYVLIKKKAWVGYCGTGENLPQLTAPVIGSNALPFGSVANITGDSLSLIDYWYAKDYEWIDDIKIIGKAYRYLGNK